MATYERRDDRRSRRSPSPPPRREEDLPSSFGRISSVEKTEDTKNVLEHMKLYDGSPLNFLHKSITKGSKVKVWTRNFKEVRGICTGRLVAFDKHWNIIMKDVFEVYLKPRRAKTPFLEEIPSTMPDLPEKKPKEKKAPGQVKVESPKAQETDGSKKRRRVKKKGPKTMKRNIDQMFIRGDNIVMISCVEEEVEEEEEEKKKVKVEEDITTID